MAEKASVVRSIFLATLTAFFTLLGFSIVVVPLALLVWALVKYGEEGHEVVSQCSGRIQGEGEGEGFMGNSDFYGLGIRLGIYLQWAGSLIANATLPRERRSMAGAYVAFSVALLVALLLLVFQRECAFTAEIIILIDILYGGALLVLMPYLAESDRNWSWDDMKGLETAALWLFLPLLPISAWFWLRLATVGEVDFAPTPGGTSFFLFAHVTSADIGAASRFMSFLCLWFISTPLFRGILAFLQKMEIKSPLRYLLYIIPVLCNAFLVLYVFSYIFGFCYGLLWRNSMLLLRRLTGRPSQQWMDKKVEDGTLENSVIAVMGFIIYIWLVIAVELTLKWNAVEGVYVVNSTGQVIPLVVGIGIMLNIFWKLIRHEKEPTSDNDDVEMHGAMPAAGVTASFQEMDGSWR